MRISTAAIVATLLTSVSAADAVESRWVPPSPAALPPAAAGLPLAPPGDVPPPPAPPPRSMVDVPAQMTGSLVMVTTTSGRIDGMLISVDDANLVIDDYSGDRVTVRRADVLTAQLRFADSGAPSPWGFWGGFGVGPAWGQSTGRAAPAGTFAFDLGLSYHFVYLGTGIGVTWFGGAGDFSNETTGGTLSSGSPISFGGYVEAGLIKGFFFPYSATEALELRPGIGYGLWGMTAADQGIDNCIDCDSRSFNYNGAHYVRFQLGVYRSEHRQGALIHGVFMSQNGIFFGGTASFQEFVFGATPRLNHVLTFSFTVGWGR